MSRRRISPGYLRRGWLRPARLFCFALLVGLGASPGYGDDFVPPSTPPASLRPAYDVVVAGAGTGGIGAAIQAARMGASVLLLEETDWVGGQMLAAAVSAMDEGGAGNLVRGRGLYRELVQRIEDFYRPRGLDPFTAGRYTNTRVEPRVGRRIVHAMLAEVGRAGTLDLSLRARIVRVHRSEHTVTGVEIEWATPGGPVTRTVASRVLIDATEWGDVLPLTGAVYRAGNRTSDALDLSRRIQDNTWTVVIKQYPQGVPEALRITAPPPGYAAMHPVFAKAIVPGDAPQRRGSPMSWAAFVDYRGMPDSARATAGPQVTRTHLNFTNDYPTTVADLEDPAQRQLTGRAMRLRTLQLLHYLQNTLGQRDWSVADDEGFDSPHNRAEIDTWVRERPEMAPYRAILYHFSLIPYVRESRRLVGVHTLLAREISRGPGRKPVSFPTTVALGDYRVDLHGGKKPADLELELDRLADLEDAQPGRAGPFPIPAGCLIPETIDGLLAAEKNFSQTRLVNGASRMQPHTLNVGQAAGALAALAVRHGVPPRGIDPVLVQRALLAAGSTLHVTPLQDVPPDSADWAAIQLVTVHGLLALANGRFEPQRPLAPAEFALMLQPLGVPAGATSPERAPVTRGELARALANADARVALAFSATDADRRLPVTRSEAAQVVAEFIALRAEGRLKGARQTLTWNSVRPHSTGVPAATVSTAGRALQRLLDARIIGSAAYWAEHAVDGKDCDGARVAELLLNGAQAIDATATATNVFEVLMQARIISARDYWAKSAVPGGRCTGRNVAAVVRNLAQHPAIIARAAQRPKSD